MAPNVLITPTLLNSFEFAKNAPPSWKEKAMRDFITKIRREPSTFPSWVKKGIEFEDAVYAQCNKARRAGELTIGNVGSQLFQDVANSCMGGTFQDVFKKTLNFEGLPVLFFQKTDVVFPNKIIDIKTTLKWKGDEKYLKGWQHKLYPWAAEKQHFEYLVVVWESENSNVVKEIHTVNYDYPDELSLDVLEDDIVEGVHALFAFLKSEGLWDDYYHTFSKNRR